jgi:hypothetical protein
MRYVMKQKLFSWGDDFIIKNEQGEEMFFADGKDDVLLLASTVVIGHGLSRRPTRTRRLNELSPMREQHNYWRKLSKSSAPSIMD